MNRQVSFFIPFEFHTPHGRMMATMLAGIALFGRDLVSECM